MITSRRRFLHLTAGIAALPAATRLAWAQDYPSRPVRLMVGGPAGGQLDIIARLAGEWLAVRLQQPFIIENRPGAGTNIATEAVIRAPADGYTLLFASATNAINATLYDNLKFEFVRDTVPVASISRIPLVLVVNPAFPAQDCASLIEYAKANPGRINLATPSKGTGPYMAAKMFAMMADIDVVQVPYRGDARARTDLIGGQIQAAVGGMSAYFSNIRAGKVRALAVTTAKRLAQLPDVPTIGATVPGYEASGWCGIVAPKGTPGSVVDKLNVAVNAALTDPKFRQRLDDLGVSALMQSPGNFGKYIIEETKKWSKVVKYANREAT